MPIALALAAILIFCIGLYAGNTLRRRAGAVTALEADDLHLERRAVESAEAALRRALQKNEFALYYQPVMDVGSGEIVAAEALIRWDDPLHGTVLPDEFIPLAEETGFVLEIGKWVLREACVQAKLWNASGFRIKTWINISAAQLHHPDFVESVREVLVHTGLHANAIGLELTESAFIDERNETIAALRELKKVGVSIALDDFGVAYSSLDYLRRLPIDALKIDRSFLRNISKDRFNQAIVRAIVGIAHDLDLRVIAEGVERTDQFDFLADLGCDDWQGFYYAHAVNAVQFARLMRTPHAQLPRDGDVFGQSAV